MLANINLSRMQNMISRQLEVQSNWHHSMWACANGIWAIEAPIMLPKSETVMRVLLECTPLPTVLCAIIDDHLRQWVPVEVFVLYDTERLIDSSTHPLPTSTVVVAEHLDQVVATGRSTTDCLRSAMLNPCPVGSLWLTHMDGRVSDWTGLHWFTSLPTWTHPMQISTPIWDSLWQRHGIPMEAGSVLCAMLGSVIDVSADPDSKLPFGKFFAALVGGPATGKSALLTCLTRSGMISYYGEPINAKRGWISDKLFDEHFYYVEAKRPGVVMLCLSELTSKHRDCVDSLVCFDFHARVRGDEIDSSLLSKLEPEFPQVIRKCILMKQYLQFYLHEHALTMEAFLRRLPYFTASRARFISQC